MNPIQAHKLLLAAALALLPAALRADYNADDDTAAAVLQSFYAGGLWDGFVGWGDACALETIENTIVRTNGQSYLGVLPATYAAGAPSGFIDNYYDDEGWWCNAWIRAYDLTGDATYLAMAKSIYNDITGGWDASVCGGGLWWQKPNNYKSAISNELFLLESVRLHQRTPGDTTYLNWANAEWSWFSGTGVINAGNLVNDGVDSTTCANNNGGVYTYNQGVILAGLVDMYKVTLNPAYLSKAEAIANACIAAFTNAGDVFTVGGGGDGAQFNGIFARYLFYLYDEDHNPAYYKFLAANAQSIWANDRDGSNQMGYVWTGPVQLSLPGSHNSAMNPGAVIADPWTATMAFVRGAGDPEFSHSTGYASGSLAWTCDPASDPVAGYMLWGPYVSYLPTGTHTVHFRLAASALNCSSAALCHLDVREGNGGASLAAMDVPWSAFAEAGKPQDFALTYTNNTAGDPLEFRAYWNAVAGGPALTISDVSVDGGLNWTGANLGHAVGRLDGVNNWEADSGRDPSGYMIQGPGTSELGNANCQAAFEMKVDDFGLDSNLVATLSVVDEDSGATVASQAINRNQFPNVLFQTFTLPFTAQEGHHYDYRVYRYEFNYAPRVTVRGVYTSVLSTLPVPTPTPPACATAGTFGNAAAGTGGYNLGGQLDCARYTLAQAMTVDSLNIFMGSGTSGSGVLGIYTDNAGSPGTRLVQSQAQPLFPGWNTFGVPPTSLPAGLYWLSGSFTGAAYYNYSNPNGGTLAWLTDPYTGTLPCSVGSTTGYGWLMCINADGCLAPTPTSTSTSTSTSTATATATATATTSASTSSTPNPSLTATPTPSPSVSTTLSQTLTLSARPTGTCTVSSVPTATSTAAPTAPLTPTATDSAVPTPLATASGTPSRSETQTPPPSPTWTPTASPTGVPTSSRTPSPVGTDTLTPPSATNGSEVQIDEAAGLPNPDPHALTMHLLGKVTCIRVQCYTTSLVRIWQEDSGPLGPGWQTMPMAPADLASLNRGLYYLSLTPLRHATAGKACLLKLYVTHGRR